MKTIFDASFLLVAPFWALMILAPRWSFTRRIAASPAIAIGPAIIYTLLVLPRLASVLPIVAGPELETVAALLGSPDGATIGWQHFLAFDLLIAQRIHAAAVARGLSAWLLAPLLVLTLLLGPIGWLVALAFGLTNAGTQRAPGSTQEDAGTTRTQTA